MRRDGISLVEQTQPGISRVPLGLNLGQRPAFPLGAAARAEAIVEIAQAQAGEALVQLGAQDIHIVALELERRSGRLEPHDRQVAATEAPDAAIEALVPAGVAALPAFERRQRLAELGGKAHEIGRGDSQPLPALAGERGAIAEQPFGPDAQVIGHGRGGLPGAQGHGVLVQGRQAQPQRFVAFRLWLGGIALARWRSGRSLRRRLVLRGFFPERRLGVWYGQEKLLSRRDAGGRG